jgi:hypothetical protein
VFIIGGLWHGAGWTFLLWGGLHAVGSVIHRLWMRLGIKMWRPLAWLITFLFVNFAWVFFRAADMAEAWRILRGMLGFGVIMPTRAMLVPLLPAIVLLAVFFPIVLCTRNSNERLHRDHFKPSWRMALACAAMFIISLLYFNRISEFLYFNF